MQLMELHDDGKRSKQVLTNPLRELGKRLEESDSSTLSQNNVRKSDRGMRNNGLECRMGTNSV